MEAKDSFKRTKFNKKDRPTSRLSKISAKMRCIWSMATCLFQLNCFRPTTELHVQEDLSRFKGLSTYLTPLEDMSRAQPLPSNLAKSPPSRVNNTRLDDSTIRGNEVLAKARIKKLKSILGRMQDADKAETLSRCILREEQKQTTSDSSLEEINGGDLVALAHSYSSS